MMDEMKKIGRTMTKDDFHCMPCDETRSGGFSPDDGILLCQNRLGSKTRQEQTMVHEMVHMYDHHKFKVDWTNLRHHACSEVSMNQSTRSRETRNLTIYLGCLDQSGQSQW